MSRRRKPGFEVRRSKIPNGKKHWYIEGRPNGERQRAWFDTKDEAEAEANDRNAIMGEVGEKALIDHTLISDARNCATRLKGTGKTLREAVDFFLAHHKAKLNKLTVNEFCAMVTTEYERRVKCLETSPRNAATILETMGKFSKNFGDTELSTLDDLKIKNWLSVLPNKHKQPLSVGTRNRHFDSLRTAFYFAVEQKVIEKNPLQEVKKFGDSQLNPEFVEPITPEILQKFLDVVRPDFIPYYVICAFTGYRSEEVAKMEWHEIIFDRKVIILPPHKVKKRKRKVCDLSDHLIAILKPFAQASGFVMPRSPKLQGIREEGCKEAQIVWQQNFVRHAFCSYSVALKGFAMTAIQSSHSEKELRDTYYEAKPKEEAERFFLVAPKDNAIKAAELKLVAA